VINCKSQTTNSKSAWPEPGMNELVVFPARQMAGRLAKVRKWYSLLTRPTQPFGRVGFQF
jgi:hypothetical protein